jgi:hypothetical protein
MAKAKPTQVELNISYSLGIKANIAKFENADAHVSRSEKWNVEGLSQKEIDAFYVERYTALKDELTPIIEAEYEEFHK